jgi:hypothetical protein
MIWRCLDCRQAFDEPHMHTEPGGSSEYMGMVKFHTEYVESCPACRSESIEEGEEVEEEAPVCSCGGLGCPQCDEMEKHSDYV